MRALNGFLRPQRHVELAATPDQARYVRSYLLLRFIVGLLGLGLPVVVVLIDALWFKGTPVPRDSLSAYYYSGMREVFVGGLAATGVFLVSYKIADRNLDNLLSSIAGIGALGVALLPTRRPDSGMPLTPLQESIGETAVAAVHILSAFAFIISLAGMSVLFAMRERTRRDQAGKRSPEYWRRFHLACTSAMVLALCWIGIFKFGLDRPRFALLIGEAGAVMAFGLSWLAKGFDRSRLRRPARGASSLVFGSAAERQGELDSTDAVP